LNVAKAAVTKGMSAGLTLTLNHQRLLPELRVMVTGQVEVVDGLGVGEGDGAGGLAVVDVPKEKAGAEAESVDL